MTGWAQASQAESGDQDSPLIAPSSDAASSVTCPDATSTTSSLPSRAAAATVAPSGEAARLMTSPSWPAARVAESALAARAGDLQGVGAGGVGDPDRLPGLAEHPRQPGPGRGIDVQRAGRAVLVRQPVHRAAHLDHAGLPGLVTVQAAQVIARGDQPRRPGRRRGAQGDLQLARLRRLRRVQDPDIAGHVVDDPLPVRGRVPRVHAVMIGMTADLAAVQRARVDVPGALVIGQEEQPAPDQHRAGQLTVQIAEHPREGQGRCGVPVAVHSLPARPPRYRFQNAGS